MGDRTRMEPESSPQLIARPEADIKTKIIFLSCYVTNWIIKILTFSLHEYSLYFVRNKAILTFAYYTICRFVMKRP